ncbi:hypothetical protein O181_079528 [Austropuccinia psidii MF-1]|uniref:Uncharacterized protein n=1 Tax=Austropuccinia psidii MF-1 TaxID=1389203 RepID=A0A9Q3IFP4_9BASI|nr:hypothetical protein [Austropuccinia psidii MF-1]
MVHTRNGSSYSVQPDGPGQGRGRTGTRLVPTNFDVNSEPELIEGNILRDELLASGSNGNISVPIQRLAQSSRRRGVVNLPKPLGGAMNIYLQIKSFVAQEKTIELFGGWSLLSCKDKVKKIKNWLKNNSILLVYQKKELEMTPALEEGPVASTSSKLAPEASKEKPKGPQKKKKGPKSHQGKGKGEENWHRPYPQGYRIPRLEPSAMDSVFNMARTLMEFIAKGKERMNRTFPFK